MASASTSNDTECQYGTKCYRKNPHHLMTWNHKHLETILPRFQNQGLKLTPDVIQEFQIQNPELIAEQLSIIHTCKLSESDSAHNPSLPTTSANVISSQSKRSKIASPSVPSSVTFNQIKSAPQQLPRVNSAHSNPHSSSTVRPARHNPPPPQNGSSSTVDPLNADQVYLTALQGFSAPYADSPAKCSICLSDESPYDDVCTTTEVYQLQICQHLFHAGCLVQMMKNSSPVKSPHINCPECKQCYGVRTGTQPTNGRMQSRVLHSSLQGHPDCGTIEIVYTFKAGNQGAEHPHPGQVFTATGFPRRAFLPDNEKGRLVLKLLKVAFDRRLVFTVGRSVTTGADDTVTWNDIHHKTKTTGPHGYPDENFLDNILEELKNLGITETAISSDTP